MAGSSEDAFRRNYDRHIKSRRWKNMRKDVAKLRGGKCERCGSGYKLELHHVTYERVGRELLTDLELLCLACHEEADRARARQGWARSAEALDRARFDGWAEKKYGEDWRQRPDEEEIRDAFDRWLEDNGE